MSPSIKIGRGFDTNTTLQNGFRHGFLHNMLDSNSFQQVTTANKFIITEYDKKQIQHQEKKTQK